MSRLQITLPGAGVLSDGKQVSFRAPCQCADITCLHINGVDYAIVDNIGNSLAGTTGVWVADTIVSVIIDETNKKAVLQGGVSANYVTVAINEALGDYASALSALDDVIGGDI